jgi:1,4-dihydroxy-2-naphthoyl-CoA hydrolase
MTAMPPDGSRLPVGPFPGFDAAVGTVLDELTRDKVVAHVDLGPQHHQPFGIVHGGVYCSIVELIGSLIGSLNAPEGKVVVGVNNNTHFLASMSEGRVIATGTPISRGRTQQLWNIDIVRESDARLVATGQLRLQAIDPRS